MEEDKQVADGDGGGGGGGGWTKEEEMGRGDRDEGNGEDGEGGHFGNKMDFFVLRNFVGDLSISWFGNRIAPPTQPPLLPATTITTNQ